MGALRVGRQAQMMPTQDSMCDPCDPQLYRLWILSKLGREIKGDQSKSRCKRGRSRLIGESLACAMETTRGIPFRGPYGWPPSSGAGAASFLPGRRCTGVCDEKSTRENQQEEI